MSTMNELIERGNKLAEKYNEEELRTALRDAIAINDNDERLSLQWALKTQKNEKNGYKYTLEETEKAATKLSV